MKEDITLSKINLKTIKKLAMTLLFMKLALKNIENIMIFYDSNKIINDFLTNGKSRYQVGYAIIKAGFFIENFQPVPMSASGNLHVLTSVRYWLSETYRMKSFNDFIFKALKNILRRE